MDTNITRKFKNLNKHLLTIKKYNNEEKPLFKPKDRYKLYEKLYFHELDRRDKMLQRLSLPVAITLGLLGFCSYLLNNKPSEMPEWALITYWLFLVASILLIMLATWFFRVVWIGYKDEMLPTPRSLENYAIECKKTYSDYRGNEDAESSVYIAMNEYFIRTTTKMTMTNDKRSFNLFLVTVCLFLSMICSIIAYTPVFIDQQRDNIHDKAAPPTAASYKKCQR